MNSRRSALAGERFQQHGRSVSKLHRLAKVSEIPAGKAKSFECAGVQIAVFHAEGRFFAIEDRCTHAEVNLSAGWVEGKCVSCPWHGAQFDLETGEALSLPAENPVRTFTVHVAGDDLSVEVD